MTTERTRSADPSRDAAPRGMPGTNEQPRLAGQDQATTSPLRFGFDPATGRMTVRGELDFPSSAALADAMAILLEGDPGGAVVDVRDLRFADAASLTLFLASCSELRRAGLPLVISGAAPDARRACEAAGLRALLADH
jgi:anti-anti-sigma factor